MTTAMEKAAVARFFSAPTYAVAGASADPAKYGHKVLLYYLSHHLPVQPIHPSLSSIPVPTHLLPTPIPTLPSLSHLPSPSTTSLSIITPPHVTLALLDEAKKVGIHSVWLQPGTYDEKVMSLLEGEGWWEGRWVGKGKGGRNGEGGWCVLVDGEVGREWAREAGEEKGRL